MQAVRRSCSWEMLSGCRTQMTQIPKLQDLVAKFPCAPGTALSHSSLLQSHDFPSVSISRSVSSGRTSHQAPFLLHFWQSFSLDNFSRKGKRIFSPLQLLISFSSYPSQSLLPSLLCCPEPPAQIQPGQLSQKPQKLFNISGSSIGSRKKLLAMCPSKYQPRFSLPRHHT